MRLLSDPKFWGSDKFPPDGRLTTGFAGALGAPVQQRRDSVTEKPSAHNIARPVLAEVHTREGHSEDDRRGHVGGPAEDGDEERDPRHVPARE